MPAPTSDDWQKFCASTGQLVLQFAAFECHLSACLRFNLSWKIDTARSRNTAGFAGAVYGSLRFKASRDTIKRVVQEEGVLAAEQIEALGSVFEHAAHIANLRDKLAHQHTYPHPEGKHRWLITDSLTTRKISNSQTWQTTTNSVDRATSDLSIARHWIGDAMQSGTLLKFIHDEPPAWQYKPSSLELLDPESVRALRELLRQQLPSRD